MAGKINIDSRYRTTPQILENDGKLIFVIPRRPIIERDFVDNIVHTVRDTDTVDLISFIYYDTERYGWIIADFNDLLFPDDDLHTLDVVVLPSKTTLLTEILPNL